MYCDVSAALTSLLKETVFTIPGSEITSSSGYVAQANPSTRTFQAAILPMTADDLRFYEPGTYTTQDKQVFTTEDSIPIGARFEQNAMTYEIAQVEDYLEEACYAFHIAKRVLSS